MGCLGCSVPMAYPRSILEYASRIGIPLQDVVLPCKFCEKFLEFLDCVAFDCKGLNLIWRDDLVYGACMRCCTRLAVAEFKFYYEYSVNVSNLIEQENKCLSDILVRCAFCLQSLSLTEKIISGSCSLIHKVRGNWRSICMYCMPNNEG
ncbi:E6 protein [Bos taurus papillomavirus 17]|uniref:Protein E6 n=1 Tax=Bos taurus papillomavirus 17 TaxID=1887215 RepID=A0A1B2K2A2_9PAPI|nr:E6 protein [Bos taurus papillomavirus 17]ANZ90238.1 E6 protein [Bos taurus papillomavirus 17]